MRTPLTHKEDSLSNRAQIENDKPRIATVSSSTTKREALRLATIYRDPQDVHTVIHLARSGIVLTPLRPPYFQF